MEIHIEGQNLEIQPEWREKIEEELARLEEHYMGPVLHARVEIIGTRHHHLGAFEVHLVVSVTGDTITIIGRGNLFRPCWLRPLMPWTAVFWNTPVSSNRIVKTHEEHAQRGKVIRLFPGGDYGFIEDQEGAEIYFHANALKNGKFEKLAPGTEVKFAAEEGEKGLQAVWVKPMI